MLPKKADRQGVSFVVALVGTLPLANNVAAENIRIAAVNHPNAAAN
jgi:hypothetical protein